MADGWAVQVTAAEEGGREAISVYYAHISDRSAAVEAVARLVSDTPHAKVEADETVAHMAFVGMDLPEREVWKWV